MPYGNQSHNPIISDISDEHQNRTIAVMSTHFLQHQTSSPHEDAVWQLTWTNKNEVVSASADGGVRVWSPTEPSKPVHHLKSHRLGVSSLSVDSTGTRALSTSIEGNVVLSDLAAGTVLGKKETFTEESEEGAVISSFSLSMHPSSSHWASTGQSAKIGFYTLPAHLRAGSELNDVPEGETDEAGLGTLEKVVETGKSKFGMCLKYSPDGRSLALSTESGQIMILDTETRQVVATHTSHAMSVRTLSWSGDSQYLFSGSDDRRIVLHDVRAGSAGSSGRGSAAVAELKGHSSWVLSLGASPDGRALVSGGADSTLRLWDVSQRACLSTTQTGSQVWAVDWQPIQADQTRVGKDFVWGGEEGRVNWMRSAGSGN